MTALEVTGRVTKSEAAEKLGLKTYDTALPQPWLDSVVEKLRQYQEHAETPETSLYDQILSSFVWCYDGSLLGYPRPLTTQAHTLLVKLDKIGHTHYADSITEVLNINA